MKNSDQHILQNIFFSVPQKKETQAGLEQCYEW